MKLLVIGSVAFDSIETPFGKINKTLGGSGSYISLSAGYFTKPAIVAVVGNDFKKFNGFKKRGVDTSALQTANGKTFHWMGKYGLDLNTRETLKLNLGVFANFTPRLNTTHSQSEYVFLGNIAPKLQMNVLKQIQFASRRTKFVGLDTINFWIEKAKSELLKVLKQVDIFIINDSEARELSGENNILKCAKKILEMMVSPTTSPALDEDSSLKRRRETTLIIKRGEYGLLMFRYSHHRSYSLQTFHLPGLPLENVVDPTGAGDSFAGGFMGYLAKTDNISWANLKTACLYGSTMASFCVQNFGVKGIQNLKQKQISQRVKEFETLTDF